MPFGVFAGGGFGCLPGSHRTAQLVPDSWVQLSGSDGVHPLVQRVAVRAGSAIVFTEALIHATLPWTAPAPRTTVFFKYCRQDEWYSSEFFSPADSERFALCGGIDTERVRAILSPPSAEAQRAVAAAREKWENKQTGPRL